MKELLLTWVDEVKEQRPVQERRKGPVVFHELILDPSAPGADESEKEPGTMLLRIKDKEPTGSEEASASRDLTNFRRRVDE